MSNAGMDQFERDRFFTPKSKEIRDMMKDAAGSERTAGRCVFGEGDGHSMTFKDDLSGREYRISGMCQSCQDGVFG